MGKTIRRKDDKNNSRGYYDCISEERNHPDAGNNYYHSDMPSRRGRWTCTSPVKDEGNSGRRAEKRHLTKKAMNDPELDTQYRDQKVKHSDRWNYD